MNGGGYAPFDLDPFAGGYHQQPPGNGSPQQQRTPYQIQGMQMPPVCYEGYDPAAVQTVPAPQPVMMGLTLPYNPTAQHTVLQPSSSHGGGMEAAFLEPDPIATSVEQRHHRAWAPHGNMDIAANLLGSLGDPSEELLLPQVGSAPTGTLALPPQKTRKVTNPDAWLDSISVNVSGVSLEPLSGSEIISRVKSRTADVERRYLPCVGFLVSCQQELRQGLADAARGRLGRQGYRTGMNPRQFYQRYLEPLPNRFFNKNHRIVESSNLTKAFGEVKKLCADAKKVEYQGCETMKNTFLGGMKDGESWGLRKWLSRNGGALHICNDLECILLACQKLDRNSDNTRRLAERLRPLAKKALNRLKNDVPASYQEQSSAHPYLPFFHRLECALRGMSNFDPEDDDVICIDDEEEIAEVKTKASAPKVTSGTDSTKRQRSDYDEHRASKRKKISNDQGESSDAFSILANVAMAPTTVAYGGDGSDDHSDVEVVGFKTLGSSVGVPQQAPAPAIAPAVGTKGNSNLPLRCARCTMLNSAGSSRCCMCDQTFDRDENFQVEEENYDSSETFEFADIAGLDEATASIAAEIFDAPETDSVQETAVAASLHSNNDPPLSPSPPNARMSASDMAYRLENIAYLFDVNKQNMVRPQGFYSSCFWDSRVQYASAIRLFVTLIRTRESRIFLEPVNEADLLAQGKPRYCDVVRNPLCFHDIVMALHDDGILPCDGLSRWNVWRGKDLLQAIDLVLLNSLAYNGKERTRQRSQTNALRKMLWAGINSTITSVLGHDTEKRRECTPTRRGEHSGFVVRKAPLV